MNKMNPTQSLRDVNGDSPAMLEQAQVAASAYGRIEDQPSRPARDATFNNSGGYGSLVSAGRGDDVPFPQDVAAVGGVRSSAAEPTDFGHKLTPVPEDGFTDRGSGITNIIRNGR